MEEINFEKAFEVLKQIESQVVPKAKYEESQNEVEKLKSMLEDANGQVRGLVDEFKNMRARWECEKEQMKAQHKEQKLKFDVVEAEKKRLEAVANNWEASYNEINLKLTLKNHQFNSLTAENSKSKADETQKCSIGTQTIKEEPDYVPAVNVPSSCSSSEKSPDVPTLFTELQNSPTITNFVGIKRKRSESANQDRRKSKRMNTKKIFNCEFCISDWSDAFEEGNRDVTDSSDYISSFSSVRELKVHMIEEHGRLRENFCKKKSCLGEKNHRSHGDLVCDTCGRTFHFEWHLDAHNKLVHGNIPKMSIDQLSEVHDLILEFH